jgi:hypothetical protein
MMSAALNYDANKFPLGKLSKTTILVHDIEEALAHKRLINSIFEVL